MSRPCIWALLVATTSSATTPDLQGQKDDSECQGREQGRPLFSFHCISCGNFPDRMHHSLGGAVGIQLLPPYGSSTTWGCKIFLICKCRNEKYRSCHITTHTNHRLASMHSWHFVVISLHNYVYWEHSHISIARV